MHTYMKNNLYFYFVLENALKCIGMLGTVRKLKILIRIRICFGSEAPPSNF
jgi:hypothetical protein